MHAEPTPVALVTGTSTGIGLESAVALAHAGMRVVATLRDLEKSDALTARAAESGATLDVRALDVTDDAAARACVGDVLDDYGAIDVLVNNAGAGFLGTLEQFSLDELDEVMATNFFSVARMCQLVLPSQRAKGAGRILTVTSVGGVVGQPFNDAYCAAKFAVEGLLESLAPVAATFGIAVSIIEPGPVATAFVDTVTKGYFGRLGEPVGDTPVEDPFAEALGAYVGRVSQTFSTAQSAEEVAAVIAAVATDPAPRLRYQTSEGARQFVAPKLADLDGSAVLSITSAWVRPA